jgi:hypothetical protein
MSETEKRIVLHSYIYANKIFKNSNQSRKMYRNIANIVKHTLTHACFYACRVILPIILKNSFHEGGFEVNEAQCFVAHMEIVYSVDINLQFK